MQQLKQPSDRPVSQQQRQHSQQQHMSTITSAEHHYKQRDLTQSHLCRLGARLFGSVSIRRRIIDSDKFLPPIKTPHATLLERNLDGMDLNKPEELDCTAKIPLAKPVESPTRAAEEGFSLTDYRDWLASRQELRLDLDGLGVTEKWLRSKECTPLENSLLAQFRERAVSSKTGSTDTRCSSKEQVKFSTSSQVDNHIGSKQAFKRRVRKQVEVFEKYFRSNRFRIVSGLLAADGERNGKVTMECFVKILKRCRAPIDEESLTVLLDAVGCVCDDDRVDYRMLLKAQFMKELVNHLWKQDLSQSPGVIMSRSKSWTASIEHLKEKEKEKEDIDGTTPSTLPGENGRLVDSYRHEELVQFNALLDHCKSSDVVLTEELLTKALLLPADADHIGKVSLRQPGLSLLSSHFADPPVTQEEEEERDPTEEYGWQYRKFKKFNGARRRAKLMKLSTGHERIKCKVDCWMTFDEYQRLTEKIRSKSGFKYKYYGLPENSAFWPGAVLDKLRPYLDSETLTDKPYSAYNVFQPVFHPKICNPFIPNSIEQRTTWPENSSGHVQFGSQNRKTYIL